MNAEQAKGMGRKGLVNVKSGRELWFMRRLRLNLVAEKGSAKHTLRTLDKAISCDGFLLEVRRLTSHRFLFLVKTSQYAFVVVCLDSFPLSIVNGRRLGDCLGIFTLSVQTVGLRW